MDCPVCLTRFTGSSGTRVPKVFLCGHTVCEACVSLLPKQASQRVMCPLCRVETSADQLKTNFALSEAAEKATTPKNSTNASAPTWSPPCQQAMDNQALGQPLLQGKNTNAPSAPAMHPWDVGPQNVYAAADTAFIGADVAHMMHFAAPVHDAASADWLRDRRETLREWGRKREKKMHRRPSCLMDQMVSGSGLYPIRLLDDEWFTERELTMIHQLEGLFQETGHSHALARDMLSPLIYGVDVRIILDNSGSMGLDMFGDAVNSFSSYGRGFDIEAANPYNASRLGQALQAALPMPSFMGMGSQTGPGGRGLLPAVGGLSPFQRRWFYARYHMRKWAQVFQIMGMDPWVYLLNSVQGIGRKLRMSQIEQVFTMSPQGTTPMAETLRSVVNDHLVDDDVTHTSGAKTMLVLAITDGEANDMIAFNAILDQIQNGVWGDVQVCLMGMSLKKEDIEWFENEECDETRIRTVEAFEVEQRQIQLKEVMRKEGGYTFAMHTYRVLITNYFPADYDYEAPLQNLRHRLYITMHGRDRWWGLNNQVYKLLCAQMFCAACFVGTCFHCGGYCQGNDMCACKYQLPELLEGCCGEE